MKRHKPQRLVCTALLACAVLLSCGLTTLATTVDSEQLTIDSYGNALQLSTELFPADVQTVITDAGRQIIRTYILTPEQSPADIPRDGFIRDGWRYTLTDITQQRTSVTDTRIHTETVEINTDSNDLNAILSLLSPTIEFQSEDGFHGILSLDISSISCEPAGHRTSSFTVTATREYPHLSSNDMSLIPRTITENGRTLTLDSVAWEAQRTVNIDYHDIPTSYRAIATYTARASRTVVTGYVTTARYVGEISKVITGNTIYTAFFEGTEINPAPIASTEPTTLTPEPRAADVSEIPLTSILTGLAVLTMLAGAAAFYFKRRNVKIYRDGFHALAARDKISAKNKLIDLSPLDGERFGIEIDKIAAKALNGQTIEVKHGTVSLNHKIAYEGNAYRMEADFSAGNICAIY